MELKESKVEVSDDSIKKDIEENSMRCRFSGEDDDEEVDILECCNEIEVSECSNDDDTDVCSSSFSGTVSEHETEETASDDQEADSMMCNVAASLPFCVRKKRLTDHWRRFIRPIMWRCKWLELKIRELQNQARKYDKELQESCQAKQLELENLKSEELGIKALSLLPCHAHKTRLKKRKKRKRVEEASDVPSYALNHNLFSYHDNRKSFTDVALNALNLDKKNKNSKEEAVFCEETLPLEFREGDAFLEQILLKIEAAKLEARNLKNRVDKLVNENPIRFSSEQQIPLLVIKNEDDEDTQPEDEESTDILLSETLASRQREGKANVPNKKLQKTKQTSVEEGPSRPVRIRKPRNLDVEVKEETNSKRRRVSKEKPKSNVTVPSRPKRPNRNRKRGKRRSGSTGSRRRS